jgi:hypothetical protein
MDQKIIQLTKEDAMERITSFLKEGISNIEALINSTGFRRELIQRVLLEMVAAGHVKCSENSGDILYAYIQAVKLPFEIKRQFVKPKKGNSHPRLVA